jgi:ferritin-like metal-binding protein YciE
MPHDEALRDKLVKYIEDAYAMEHHLVEVLEKQVKDVQQYPDVLAAVQRHPATTRQRPVNTRTAWSSGLPRTTRSPRA